MPKEKKEIKDIITALTECNEGRTYQFACGLTAHQQELTLRQDKLLAALITKINKDKLKDLSNVQLAEFIDLLLGDNLLDDALNIILNTTDVNYDGLTNRELESVVTDFFTLNPSLSKWLGIGKPAQDGR